MQAAVLYLPSTEASWRVSLDIIITVAYLPFVASETSQPRVRRYLGRGDLRKRSEEGMALVCSERNRSA